MIVRRHPPLTSTAPVGRSVPGPSAAGQGPRRGAGLQRSEQALAVGHAPTGYRVVPRLRLVALARGGARHVGALGDVAAAAGADRRAAITGPVEQPGQEALLLG